MSSSVPQPPTHVFFTGSAWGCAFHIGVYRAMQEIWGLDKLSKIKFAGNSSGCLIALSAAYNMDWKDMENTYKLLMDNARKNGVIGEMTNAHNIAMDTIIKLKPVQNTIVSNGVQFAHADIYKKLNGRLFIGVTKFFCRYELVSEWKSNQELRNTMHGSMHIPYYCTHLACDSNGERMIDGGNSSLFHRFDDNEDEECTTLVSSVMTDKGDVCCQPLMTVSDCFSITSEEEYLKIRDRGFSAMKHWNGKYKHSRQRRKRHVSNKRMIICMMMWSMRMLEEIQIRRILMCFILCWILSKIYIRSFRRKMII